MEHPGYTAYRAATRAHYAKRDAWLSVVAEEIEYLTGMGMDDLPDFCYADAYDDGRSPKQTARLAVISTWRPQPS